MIINIVNNIKLGVKKIPFFGAVLVNLSRYINRKTHPFINSTTYWEDRYRTGGNSGAGSYGELAKYKSDFLNDFTVKQDVESVIEYGCGDGNQLKTIGYKNYIGFDVSDNAIKLCQGIFKDDSTKSFRLMNAYVGEKAQLTLSLDVLYHLVEDEVFEQYMERLFSSSEKFVIIYSSNYIDNNRVEGDHVRHRKFTDWIKNNKVGWNLIAVIENPLPYQGDNSTGSLADFYIYQIL